MFCVFALSACVAVQPLPPRIERLPEGAAGPVAPSPAGPRTLADIVEMARTGTPANVIIQTLRETPTRYALTTAEANDLSRQGVPREVIDYLLHGEPRAAAAPVYPAYPVYPAHPPYPLYAPYAPYVVVPGVFHSHWGFGPYRRFGGSWFSFRFGIRR